jgi:hypothetical protein
VLFETSFAPIFGKSFEKIPRPQGKKVIHRYYVHPVQFSLEKIFVVAQSELSLNPNTGKPRITLSRLTRTRYTAISIYIPNPVQRGL